MEATASPGGAAAAAGESETDEDGGGVHVAAVVSCAGEEEETVTNIGSTHVLGQHLSETTLTVINGVVKGASPQGSTAKGRHEIEVVWVCYH